MRLLSTFDMALNGLKGNRPGHTFLRDPKDEVKFQHQQSGKGFWETVFTTTFKPEVETTPCSTRERVNEGPNSHGNSGQEITEPCSRTLSGNTAKTCSTETRRFHGLELPSESAKTVISSEKVSPGPIGCWIVDGKAFSGMDFDHKTHNGNNMIGSR
jgi:hypothetical protein